MNNWLDDIYSRQESLWNSLNNDLFLRNLEKIKSDPKSYIDFLKSIDSSREIREVFRKPLERLIKERLLVWKTDWESITYYQIYWSKYLWLSEIKMWKIDWKYWPKTKELIKLLTYRLWVWNQEIVSWNSNNHLISWEKSSSYLSQIEQSVLQVWEKDLQVKNKQPQQVVEIKSLGESQKQIDLINTLVKSETLKPTNIYWEVEYIIDENVFLNYVLNKDRFSLENTKQYKDIDNLKSFLETPKWKEMYQKTMKIYSQLSLYDSIWLKLGDLRKNDNFTKVWEYSERINSSYIKLEQVKDKFESLRHKVEDKYSDSKDRFAWRNRYRELDDLWDKLKEETLGVYKLIIRDYLKAMTHLNIWNEKLKHNDCIVFDIWVSKIDINLKPLNKEIERLKEKSWWKIDINYLDSYIDKNIDKFLVDSFVEKRKRDIDNMI